MEWLDFLASLINVIIGHGFRFIGTVLILLGIMGGYNSDDEKAKLGVLVLIGGALCFIAGTLTVRL